VFEVRELQVRYGDERVRCPDLAAHRGEVVGLLGEGASLLVRTVAGVRVPAAGAVRLDDDDLTGLPYAEVAARGVLLVDPARRPPGALTVAENVARGAARAGAAVDRRARVAAVLSWFPALDGAARSAGLTGEAAVLLAVAVGVAAAPRLLLVDGLAAACGVAAYAEALAGLRASAAEGGRVLLAEAAGDPAAYDRAYLLRDRTVRPWHPDPDAYPEAEPLPGRAPGGAAG
jgi:branched-chain amino acid transport system ATP-binding protein